MSRVANLAAVLSALRAGPLSRAGLARALDLTRATTSSLVTDLESRGLVFVGEPQTGQFGRPGHLVSLDPEHVCSIGLEVNVDYVAVGVVRLDGSLEYQRVACDVAAQSPSSTLDQLSALAHAATPSGAWVAGVGVAIPALVSEGRVVRFAPNLHWRDVPVTLDLGAPVLVDNDANLSALAEHAATGLADLVYLTGEVGVGGGVITGGTLLRGSTGVTGEVGHLPLGSPERVCGCGRTGCWETSVGLAALGPFDPTLDLEKRLAVIAQRASSGDATTLAMLDGIGRSLGVGASVLVNVLNPAAVVLGGYFAALGEWLLPSARAELDARALAPCSLVLSELGFTAAVRGAAWAALDRVFTDPTTAPVRSS